ncbi:MAG: S8 family serine peptidase, partial [Candidatus Dormibacteria bacterium]
MTTVGACARAGTIAVAGVLLAGGTVLASSDYFFAQQWGLSGSTASINAPQAWCTSTGGALVADVDTGADFSHPDLRGRLVAGARFTSGDGSESPDHSTANLADGVGHGTGTTGLMVANKDDGIGIAGVAPRSQALVVKVFDDSGSGNTTDAAAGIRWAADHGARVINISLGADPTGKGISLTPDPAIVSAIQYAAQKHVAVAASAGNNQVQVPVSQYQQIAQVALVVGAIGPQGESAWYTATGVGVNIYAPGGDDPSGNGGTALNVVTPYKGGQWVSWQGTSFASPHVAGTLALLISRGMSAEAARLQIINTAVSRSDPNTGLQLPELDAAAALGSSGGCSAAPAAVNEAGGSTSGPRPTARPRTTAGPAAHAPASGPVGVGRGKARATSSESPGAGADVRERTHPSAP